MTEYKCDDCGATIPQGQIECDENVRTMLFQMRAGEKYRVLAISASDFDAVPTHPYLDGEDRELCARCVRDCMSAAMNVEPVTAEAG